MWQAGGRGRALWSWNPDAQDRWATDCCPLTWVLTWKVVAVCWSALSCIVEGNGNPLQCSYLEDPRARRAWSAGVSGVAQSQTQLKRLSRHCAYKLNKHPFILLELFLH